jgi:hypothetical protein
MKLIKTTKQGNQHFLLDDGRIGAIYPKTGYVRVSHSIKERKYPTTENSNNYLRLMEILTKFNYKNCQP